MSRSVTREPPKAEWEARRALIAELYLSPYLALEDVVSMMASEHNFRATHTMFKKYLRSWGLSRKAVPDKRHELVHIALAHLRVGGNLPLVDSQGRSIPWGRVKRNFLRSETDVAIWRYLQVPLPRKQSQKNQSRPVASQGEKQQGATSLPTPPQHSEVQIGVRKPDQELQLGHAFSQYRPRSPALKVERMLYDIGEFQNWRAITVPHAFTRLKLSKLGGNITVPSGTMGNVARENAALNVSNACISVYQHIVLEEWEAANDSINSAQQYFDSYLSEPSLFLLYSVLSLHIMTPRNDGAVLVHEKKLLTGFGQSCIQRLGKSHPLSQILTQLSTSSPDCSFSEWSIAILDCLAHTTDHLASEAARFTSLKMKHGLAWALQLNGYPFSAISILENIIAETLTFTNPVLGKTSWLRSQLAGIYRGQGWWKAARSVLEEAFVLANGTFDDGLLQCSSSLGQMQEHGGQIEDAERTYRLQYEASYRIHGKGEPMTTLYTRTYYDFLRRNDLESKSDMFREELTAAGKMDLEPLQQQKLNLYAKYITLEDAGYT